MAEQDTKAPPTPANPAQPSPAEPEISAGQFARALFGMLASTRTAVVLLGVIAAAAVVGTILPYSVAASYVYGRLWFHVLLGLLGLNLIACMVWRRRVGLARAWSLFTHAGILLVLLGALVTLVSAERGYLPLEPGMVSDRFWPYGVDMHADPGKPLGFAVRLVDFNVDFYRPADRLIALRGKEVVADVRLPRGREVEVPGTGLRVAAATFTPDEGPGIVEYTAPGGERRSVPAKVGSVQELEGTGLALMAMVYLPSFRAFEPDSGERQIVSDDFRPGNPALHVAVVREGRIKAPQWLFARSEERARATGGSRGAGDLDLRFLHPAFPRLEAELIGPSGARRIRIDSGEAVPSPWGDGVALRYAREPYWKVSDYRSDVEVVEGDRVVRSHTIRVNTPLDHLGTKLSQQDFDRMAARYTILGVSRDTGVWFVYAGFLAGVVGTMGRFYVSPLVRKLRARRAGEGGGPRGS